MDYFLTEEQQMIVDVARQITDEKIIPQRAALDESEEYPHEIIDAVDLIEGFPDSVEEKNLEIMKFNKGLEKRKEAAKKNPNIQVGKQRELRKLILDPSEYKVDKILIYPWAHLSSFLSQEKSAADICPTIANMLKDDNANYVFQEIYDGLDRICNRYR